MDLAFESRMLIDGELVEADRRQDLRQHQPRDRRRSSARSPTRRRPTWSGRSPRPAARSTRPSWSTDRAFRKACLQQLKEALDKHKEELRPQIVAEVGTPIGLTFAIQQDTCIDDMQWDIDLIDRYEWEYELGNARVLRHELEPARDRASRSAWSARSRRGTSRSC